MEAKPLKTLAERMKNYIKADYGNFDDPFIEPSSYLFSIFLYIK